MRLSTTPLRRERQRTKVHAVPTALACTISYSGRLKFTVRRHTVNKDPPAPPTETVTGEEGSVCLDGEERSIPNSEGTPTVAGSPRKADFSRDARDPFPAPVIFTSETSESHEWRDQDRMALETKVSPSVETANDARHKGRANEGVKWNLPTRMVHWRSSRDRGAPDRGRPTSPSSFDKRRYRGGRNRQRRTCRRSCTGPL